MIQAGQVVMHYRLIEKIGEGGMGVVWRALDTSLDREVAIKFLPAAFADDTQRLARFDREAKLLTRLHSGVLISAFDITPDGKWIVFDRRSEDSDIVLIERKPPVQSVVGP